MSEYQHQCALIEWAERMSERLPELRLLHAIPNGERRDKATGARLKRAGVRAGVPDLLLPIASGDGWHGLYIEMKTERGRLSTEQREWARLLAHQGYMVCVARNWWIAARQILTYLGEEPADFGLDRPALDAAGEQPKQVER